jgi:hypothetical protein
MLLMGYQKGSFFLLEILPTARNIRDDTFAIRFLLNFWGSTYVKKA